MHGNVELAIGERLKGLFINLFIYRLFFYTSIFRQNPIRRVTFLSQVKLVTRFDVLKQHFLYKNSRNKIVPDKNVNDLVIKIHTCFGRMKSY